MHTAQALHKICQVNARCILPYSNQRNALTTKSTASSFSIVPEHSPHLNLNFAPANSVDPLNRHVPILWELTVQLLFARLLDLLAVEGACQGWLHNDSDFARASRLWPPSSFLSPFGWCLGTGMGFAVGLRLRALDFLTFFTRFLKASERSPSTCSRSTSNSPNASSSWSIKVSRMLLETKAGPTG